MTSHANLIAQMSSGGATTGATTTTSTHIAPQASSSDLKFAAASTPADQGATRTLPSHKLGRYCR